jgi:CheY-like chemotaxis protein
MRSAAMKGSPAVAMISISGSEASTSDRVCRTNAESSTISTRTGFTVPPRRWRRPRRGAVSRTRRRPASNSITRPSRPPRSLEEIPDVIVLDVEMPRMDGITFLQKIMTQRPIQIQEAEKLLPACRRSVPGDDPGRRSRGAGGGCREAGGRCDSREPQALERPLIARLQLQRQ